jgi:drug/metabolite transporter (DMT)-like permease
MKAASMRLNREVLAAHLLLLGVVIVWGTTFSLVKAALADTTPLLFNLLRMTLAFVVLAAVHVRRLRGISRMELGLGAMAGVFLALGYQFQTAGLAQTTAAKAAFITGLVVVLVPLLSAIPGVSAEATTGLSVDALVGAVLAFGGLVLLTTPSGSGLALFSGLGVGEVLCLACALAFAAHLLVLARAAPRVSARTLGTLQIGFAALVMLVTLPMGGRVFLRPTPVLWLALGVTAVLATAAAFTIQSWAQQHLPATHTALILTLEPVFAWLTGLLFLGERLSPRALSGAGLILGGILLAELRPVSRGRGELVQTAPVDPAGRI